MSLDIKQTLDSDVDVVSVNKNSEDALEAEDFDKKIDVHVCLISERPCLPTPTNLL
jgi:hypothetical protein